jgi:hypothetical protein
MRIPNDAKHGKETIVMRQMLQPMLRLAAVIAACGASTGLAATDVAESTRPVFPGEFTISAGAGSVTDKPPAIGFFVAPDEPLLRAPWTIHTANIDGSWSLWQDAKRGWRFEIGGAQGDRSTTTEAPVGKPVGWAFWFPPPSGGTTGVSSNGGADAHFKTKFSTIHLYAARPYLLQEDGPMSWWGEPVLGFEHLEFKYNGSVFILASPGISSTTDQKVKEDELSLGYAVRGKYTFPNRVWATGAVGFDGIYYRSRYNGTQDNVCSICAAPTDRFIVSTSDSQSGWTWGGWASAAVGFSIAQYAEIFLSGDYRYRNKSGVLTDKVTPTDEIPHLQTGRRETGSVQLGFLLKFR